MCMAFAYCFLDGAVRVTDREVPQGAVEVCRGPLAEVWQLLDETTPDGRIPGLRDSRTVADDQQHLLLHLETLKDAAGPRVTVNDLRGDVLVADPEDAS